MTNTFWHINQTHKWEVDMEMRMGAGCPCKDGGRRGEEN